MDTISAEPDVRPAYQNAHHFLCFSVFQHYVLELKKKHLWHLPKSSWGCPLKMWPGTHHKLYCKFISTSERWRCCGLVLSRFEDIRHSFLTGKIKRHVTSSLYVSKAGWTSHRPSCVPASSQGTYVQSLVLLVPTTLGWPVPAWICREVSLKGILT